jgi:beta-lactamase regulating signal transducer with metallopeptidase domain
VVCHELIHVQRRDWLWVLGEETVRAVLWFNPAVWWLIARVQLAREELVDELTVLATNRRRAYMEALLAFADETPLAPAAAFARRRHLFRRMVLLSKEGVMSRSASCSLGRDGDRDAGGQLVRGGRVPADARAPRPRSSS